VRRLGFAVLAAAPALAAALLGSHHEPRAEAPAPPPTARRGQPPRAAPSPATPALRREAHRFLAAFLALEAGAEDRATRAAIRRGAAPRLARELLAGRPRPARRPGARILALRLARLPRRPGLALATGTARRRDGPEPFAFLLARRGGRWLALAPAE
jgi:hypothetical protein